MLALLCSGVAWASLPATGAILRRRAAAVAGAWRRAAVAMAARPACRWRRPTPSEPVDFVPKRAVRPVAPAAARPTADCPVTGPLRIRGRVGDGLYWSLRAAGASPQVAAQYLAALATEIDVGDVAPERRLRPGARARTANCFTPGSTASGRARFSWSAGTPTAAANGSTPPMPTRPAPVNSGLAMPVERADHFLFRLPLSPDPALHPLPRGRRHRRRLGQPDRRRRRRPGRRRGLGAAATAARSRSPTAAGSSASTAT